MVCCDITCWHTKLRFHSPSTDLGLGGSLLHDGTTVDLCGNQEVFGVTKCQPHLSRGGTLVDFCEASTSPGSLLQRWRQYRTRTCPQVLRRDPTAAGCQAGGGCLSIPLNMFLTLASSAQSGLLCFSDCRTAVEAETMATDSIKEAAFNEPLH